MIDLTLEDSRAIALLLNAMDKSVFPMIEGVDIMNIAQSKVRLSSLRKKIEDYCKEQNEKTAQEMAKKALTPKQSKDPIKEK